MWLTSDTLALSFATVNFSTNEIVWNFGEFTPKRKKALEYAISVDGRGLNISNLENTF